MDAGPTAVILFVRRPASNARSRTLVLNAVSGRAAITPTGSESRPWRRSGHPRVPEARVETSRRCVIRNCERIRWTLYGHARDDTAYSCRMDYIREKFL